MLVAVFILVYLSCHKWNRTHQCDKFMHEIAFRSYTSQSDSKFPNDTKHLSFSGLMALCKGIIYHSQVKPIFFWLYLQCNSLCCDLLFNRHELCSALFQMLSQKWHKESLLSTEAASEVPYISLPGFSMIFIRLYTECGADSAQSSIYLLYVKIILTALGVHILLHRGEPNCRIRLDPLTNI